MRLPPGPTLSPPELQQIFFANPFPFFDECRASYGETFTLDLGTFGCRKYNANGLWVFVSGEENNQLLSEIDSSTGHAGSAAMIASSGIMPANALAFSNGSERERRKKLNNEFFDKFGYLRKSIVPTVRDCISKLTSEPVKLEQFSLGDFIAWLVFDSFFSITFVSDSAHECTEIRDALLTALREKRSVDSMRRSIQTASPLVDKLIQQRKKTISAKPNANSKLCNLDAMLYAQSQGVAFTDQEIRDDNIAYFIARAKTTYGILCWAMVWLSREQETLDKVSDEVERLWDYKLEYHNEVLTYLCAVIREVLRISPFQSFHSQTLLTETIRFKGFDIPRGTIIASVPFLTHKDPSLFTNPLEFNPNRFLEAKYSPQRFAPFNVNPSLFHPWDPIAINQSANILATMLKSIQLENLELSVVPEFAQSVYIPSSINKTTIQLRESVSVTESNPA